MAEVTAQQTPQPRQTSTIEGTPEATPQPQADETRQRQLAQAAKYERALRAAKSEAQKFKTEHEALNQKIKEYESNYIPRDLFRKEPLKVMSENGISYDHLTKLMIDQPQPNPEILALRQEMQEWLNNQKTEYQKQQEGQQQQAYEQAVNQIRDDATTLINHSQEFEAIKSLGQVESIVELIKETHAQTGKILDIEDAARQVEQYLIDELGSKFLGLKKVKEKFSAPEEVTTPGTKPQAGARTLTNTIATTSTAKPRLSDRERRERAILAAQGKLK